MTRLSNPVENLSKMGNLLHLLAFKYEGDFQWLDKRITSFQELTYSEFVAYAKQFLGKTNAKRLAICVNGELPDQQQFFYQQITTPEQVRARITYPLRQL